ncbi:MAG: RluA family pseudouridine synthase [Lachnospiraceae bacterium]|nr:RluA family pseudouridine synthase [Lachnospiraceae bacterium]
MNRMITYRIEKEYDSIFAFFKEKHFPHKMQVQLKQNPEQVCVNGHAVMLRTPLRPQDILALHIVETEQSHITPVKMPLDIVYEDEDILVVNKPAMLPIHPSINHYEDTLANGLMHYYSKEASPFVFRCLNRLDRDTSGLTLVAKNPFSAAMLSRQVKARELHRTYLAIVEGKLPASGTIDAPIGRAKDSAILREVNAETGQSAITHYTCLDTRNGLSLASITLETGRTHQIRVHMTSIGHPLPGDFLYNPTNRQLQRQALHSASLTFAHPVTGQMLTFHAPIPKDMQRLLESQ